MWTPAGSSSPISLYSKGSGGEGQQWHITPDTKQVIHATDAAAVPTEALCILIGVLLYSSESQKEIQVPIEFLRRGEHQGLDGKKTEELITMEFKSHGLCI